MGSNESGNKGAELFQTVSLIGFLGGFGFVAIVCLKAFLMGESSAIALIFQFFLASLVGAFTSLIAGIFIAPIAALSC